MWEGIFECTECGRNCKKPDLDGCECGNTKFQLKLEKEVIHGLEAQIDQNPIKKWTLG